MKLKAILALLFLSAACPVWAAEDDRRDPLQDVARAPFDIVGGAVEGVTGAIYDLGFISVGGGRLESDESKAAQLNSSRTSFFVSEEELERSSFSSAPEVLSRLEGVSVTDDLGNGLGARVDLRAFGGEAKQALVLMDGLRAVEPFDNSVTWSLYPTEYFRSMHVLPGGSSPVYGEGALSGVIEMRTKEPTKDWQVKTENAFGSYHSYRTFTEVSGTTPQGLGVWLGGRFSETDGYRQNAGNESASSMMKTTYAWTDLVKVENTLYFTDGETGIAGPLLPIEEQRDRRQKDPDGQFGDKFEDRLVQDGLLIDLWGEPLGLQITDLIGFRQRDQNSVQSFGGAFPGTSLNEIQTESWSNVLQGTRSWGEKDRRYTLFTGLEWGIDDIYNPFRFEDATFGPFESERAIDRRMWGVFLQNRVELWERLQIDGGLRFDKINWDIYDLKSPHLEKHKKADQLSPDISMSLKAHEDLTFFAGYSQAFKVPDSNTLIFETPNIFSPNPNIDASTAHHYELGTRAKVFEKGSLRGALFHIETKKEILFNDIKNTNENFDTLRDGVELAFEWAFTDAIKGFASYSYTDARFDNGAFDDKIVPLVPENRWTAGAEWMPDALWTLRFEAAGADTRYALNDFNNIFRAEDYWTTGFELKRKIPKGEAFFKANNLFDERYSEFTTSDGVSVLNLNPSPEFNFEAGVRFEI